eukprot:1032981-Amphidinium_carterae.1
MLSACMRKYKCPNSSPPFANSLNRRSNLTDKVHRQGTAHRSAIKTWATSSHEETTNLERTTQSFQKASSVTQKGAAPQGETDWSRLLDWDDHESSRTTHSHERL